MGEWISERTRQVLLERARVSTREVDLAPFTDLQIATLRSALNRIIPQPIDEPIDLLPAVLSFVRGPLDDGWRFAGLGVDVVAWGEALSALDRDALALHGRAFPDLEATAQDDLLRRLDLDPTSALWFEDLRSAAVRAYVSHPDTMLRIGYDGFANGGDGDPFQGFQMLEPGDRRGGRE